MQTSMSLTIA